MTTKRNEQNLAEKLGKLARRRGIRFPWLKLPNRAPKPKSPLENLWNPTGQGRLCIG